MFTKYGTSTLLTVVFCSLAVIFLSTAFLSGYPVIGLLLNLIGLFFLVFALNFFRDPYRATDQNPNSIVSPADGKVVLIKKIDHDDFIGGPATLVAVFMSPLNVHVNRIPMDGEVKYLKYQPGQFLKAWEDKASDVNERSEIGIVNGTAKVLFKQIAGFVARRIIFSDLSLGLAVKKGERFGMIKFGSRVDVIVPASYPIKVSINQITRAGETVIAEIPGEK
ncbi:MAG: phosphatidylserine decarboxylase family protein [Bacteroidetes bacterium]|nr:phosphatidylserine decarboxylase family protein [Bacteroidota bacterium]